MTLGEKDTSTNSVQRDVMQQEHVIQCMFGVGKSLIFMEDFKNKTEMEMQSESALRGHVQRK